MRLADLAPLEQDAANMALMEQLNGSGELFLTHTRIGDRAALRLAIGGTLHGAKTRRTGMGIHPPGRGRLPTGLTGSCRAEPA